MATEAEQPVPLETSEHSALDSILRPHLRLEPQETGQVPDDGDQTASFPVDDSKTNSDSKEKKSKVALQTQSSISSRHKAGSRLLFSRPTVHQNTLESDNKRRPIVLKRNSSRYRPPSPEPPDPNSEAKSVTIRRMQNNLTVWDKQLDEINTKKLKNESLQQSELNKREEQIRELAEKLARECDVRKSTEEDRDNLRKRLGETEDDLDSTKDQCDQFQSDLAQYEAAYEDVTTQKMEIEEQLVSTTEQLQQSESMRRRLDDTVIELQGQLAIEEQRSKFCSVM